MTIKIILIHGNGGCTPDHFWFPSVKKELEQKQLTVIAEQFPDSELARASYWLPFLIDELKVDENTILVGHSSGAVAAMRVAEQKKLLGSVLVGVYHSDLGIDSEKQSGYFDSPWNWDAIRNNNQWISIFASQDDPWIPIKEPRFIHQQLNCEYHEYLDQGHFGGDYDKLTFPELTHHIIRQVSRK